MNYLTLKRKNNETLSEWYREKAVDFFESNETNNLIILSNIRRIFRERGYTNPYHTHLKNS